MLIARPWLTFLTAYPLPYDGPTHTAPAPRVTYTPALVIEPLYFRTRDDRTTGPAYTIRMQIRGGPALPHAYGLRGPGRATSPASGVARSAETMPDRRRPSYTGAPLMHSQPRSLRRSLCARSGASHTTSPQTLPRSLGVCAYSSSRPLTPSGPPARALWPSPDPRPISRPRRTPGVSSGWRGRSTPSRR